MNAARAFIPGALVVAIACAGAWGQTSPFAARVIDYQPAPGQFVNDPNFNDPARALGAPVGGGTLSADNTKVVTLGGFGGSITLAFDHAVLDQAASDANPNGLDVIIFGNAFFSGGNSAARWAECATIEVSRDVNGNGLADDPWYLIPGSYFIDHISRASNVIPKLARANVTWNAASLPASWIPPGRSGTWATAAFELPAADFRPPLFSPVYGYADVTPTLLLGDTDGDNLVDDFSLTPERFYTRPSDPFALDITPGSGGGDAFDIAWALSPVTGEMANLPSINFIRITTAVNFTSPILGEVSTEIGGVAVVSTATPPRHNLADIVGLGQIPPGDGLLTADDYLAFVNNFFTGGMVADIVGLGQIPPGDGLLTADDYLAFINNFFTGG